jgi:uncharacterized protein YqfA (UPF0365 family)
MDPRMAYLLGVATAFGAILLGWFVVRLAGPWLMAKANGTSISLVQVLGMRMRGSDARMIVAASGVLSRGGEEVSPVDLEAAYLGLPAGKRDVTELLRAVRPDLLARLERESRSRGAGGAA